MECDVMAELFDDFVGAQPEPAGTSQLIALAVFKLTTSLNLLGCSTGKSPGLAPRRTFATISARWRKSDAIHASCFLRPRVSRDQAAAEKRHEMAPLHLSQLHAILRPARW
jgi:hypothetical protein